MEIKFTDKQYKIEQYSGGEFFRNIVSGSVSGGFGIHLTDFGWNITHLQTGWSCFTCITEESARVIAGHLIENYAGKFENLKISGSRVENFKPIKEQIETDSQLKELRKLFVRSFSELASINGFQPDVKVEIIS